MAFLKLFLDKNCFLCHQTYYYKTTGFSNPGSLRIAFKGWKANCHSWKRCSLFAWSSWSDQEIHRQDKSTVFGYADGKRLCSGFRSKFCWTSKVSNRHFSDIWYEFKHSKYSFKIRNDSILRFSGSLFFISIMLYIFSKLRTSILK